MIHLYDRAGLASVSALDIDPKLKSLVTERVAMLTPDLLDYTEYLIVLADDTEEEIVRHVGFSPLVEPIDGERFGSHLFQPYWDYLKHRGGWFEMIVTFGSATAVILLIQDRRDDLGRLCLTYSETTEPTDLNRV